jgi:hypothetical protein
VVCTYLLNCLASATSLCSPRCTPSAIVTAFLRRQLRRYQKPISSCYMYLLQSHLMGSRRRQPIHPSRGFQFVSELRTSWAQASHNDSSGIMNCYSTTCMVAIARVCKLMMVVDQSRSFTSTTLLPISLLTRAKLSQHLLPLFYQYYCLMQGRSSDALFGKLVLVP